MVSAFTKKTLAKRSFARTVRDCSLLTLHEEYLRARRVEGIRDTTLSMYASALHLWAQWCASQGVTLASQVLTKHAEDFLLSLKDRKLSERTIRNRAIVVKGALKFALMQGYLASERLYGWKLPRMGRASVYMPDLVKWVSSSRLFPSIGQWRKTPDPGSATPPRVRSSVAAIKPLLACKSVRGCASRKHSLYACRITAPSMRV